MSLRPSTHRYRWNPITRDLHKVVTIATENCWKSDLQNIKRIGEPRLLERLH